MVTYDQKVNDILLVDVKVILKIYEKMIVVCGIPRGRHFLNQIIFVSGWVMLKESVCY